MFDHVSLYVSDLPRSIRFYRAALAPLGFELVSGSADEGYAGFGKPGAPQLWLSPGTATRGAHLAFVASKRDAVARFHAAALEAGGTDNGAPGVREIYHPAYYGAYVLDPDGNNVEAVCHTG
jgi:catechol 2,3-dioxygenase-like lactoylglutathione lyase family enzyme